MAPNLRIAVWQCTSMPLDVDGNLGRITAQAALAREAGAALLVCPEMVVTGYDIGRGNVHRLAEPVDGPSARRVAQSASQLGIAVCYGYPERGDDGRIYNAAQAFGADGRVLARCRKSHLFGQLDRSIFVPGSGDEPLGTLCGWRLGIAICYDIEFPECARRLAVAGADLIAVPTANMAAFDIVPRTLLPARAVENQVFVAYANYCGSESSLRYGGLSCVVAPDAESPVVAGRDEALLIADLSAERLGRSRSVFTYLHDRRGNG